MREVPRDDKWVDEAYGPQPDDGEKVADTETPVESDDPFSPENVGVVQTITLLRIYDVLLADFVEKHPKAGQKLLERHARGGFFAPPPAFNPDEIVSYEDE